MFLKKTLLMDLQRLMDERNHVSTTLQQLADRHESNSGEIQEALLRLKSEGCFRQSCYYVESAGSVSITISGRSGLGTSVMSWIALQHENQFGEIETSLTQIAADTDSVVGDIHEVLLHLRDDGDIRKVVISGDQTTITIR